MEWAIMMIPPGKAHLLTFSPACFPTPMQQAETKEEGKEADGGPPAAPIPKETVICGFYDMRMAVLGARVRLSIHFPSADVQSRRWGDGVCWGFFVHSFRRKTCLRSAHVYPRARWC